MMKSTRTTIGAIAALLVLAGCGADGGTDPAPDAPSSAVATSAPPSALPPTTTPTADISSPATPGPSGALTLAESCQAVLDDQQGAVTALRAYVRNPLSADVDVADLDRLRSELLAGELSAPEPLRQELSTQVGVLERVVQGIQDRDVQAVDIGSFEESRERITSLCEEAGQ